MGERWGASNKTVKAFTAVVVLFGIMWTVEVIDTLWGHPFLGWSLLARHTDDLWSLATFPLVHYSFGTLLINSLFGGFSAFLVASDGIRRWLVVGATSTLLGGLVGWLTLPLGTPIVGSTTLVLGYMGYLFASSVLRRDLRFISAGFVILGAYGAILWLLLPTAWEFTWPALIGGACGGVAAAFIPLAFSPRSRALVVQSSQS